MTAYTVAIVGATGLVGRAIGGVLAERRFPVGELRLLASERSAGQTLIWRGRDITVEAVRPAAFRGVDLAFFAVGTAASRELVPIARGQGVTVIDKSNAFRLDPAVPLVVPEVNGRDLAAHTGLVANPNCTAIQIVVALAPLARAAGLRRVHIASYQSVSGSGRGGMAELAAQQEAMAAGDSAAVSFYPRQIAGNLIPHIDSFDPAGFTGEECKIVNETRKLLGLPDLPIAATAVRVPVMVAHAVVAYVETERHLTRDQARAILAVAPGLRLVDDPAAGDYPTPLDAVGGDEVLVGRVREAPSLPGTLGLWIVADNLRKGAATNAVQIAEHLLAGPGLKA